MSAPIVRGAASAASMARVWRFQLRRAVVDAPQLSVLPPARLRGQLGSARDQCVRWPERAGRSAIGPARRLRLQRLPRSAGGDRELGRGRRRCARGHADRQRQVALLPDPGPAPGRHGDRGQPADRADGGSGDGAAPARRPRGVPELEPVARGAEPGSSGRPPRASSTCSTSRPSGCWPTVALPGSTSSRSRCSRSTRRTASRSGDTISARSISSSPCSASAGRPCPGSR